MITIRHARKEDSTAVWTLMKELAIFEHYSDDFAITPEIVAHSGFEKTPADFYCLVAEEGGHIIGIAVYYYLPFTAQNRPAIYLKELYVHEDHRGKHVGEQLMHALYEEAKAHNCLQIKWTVAPWNEAGQHFYHRLGARENTDWLDYEWKVES